MNPAQIKIKLGITGQRCHIELNGIDISRSVTGFDIHTEVTEFSTVTLRLINVETELDGTAADVMGVPVEV